MKELFDAAIMPVNMVPTILLGLILLYWLTVILGALDMDFLNVEVGGSDVEIDMEVDLDADVDIDADLDVDANADIDTDVDADADTDVHTDAGASTAGAIISMNAILGFFNLGKVPFMLLLSFFILPLWIISILVNHYSHNESILFSLVLLIPNILVSLFVAKFLTAPFAAIYTKMSKNSSDNFKYQGKICKLLMNIDDSHFGQAEINHEGNIYRVNVIANLGASLQKGDTALVINYIKEKKCYLVEPYKL